MADKCPANGYLIKVIMHVTEVFSDGNLFLIADDLAARRRTSVPPIQPPTLSRCPSQKATTTSSKIQHF